MDPAQPSVALEVERKFRVHGLFRLGNVRLPSGWRLGEPRQQVLDAIYFDTADLRLSRSRLTLRRREGGEDEGWHLKIPVRDEAREELSVPLGRGGPEQPPAELADLVQAFVRSAALDQVAHLRTDRTTYPVLDPEGAVRASLTDDSVSVFDGGHVVARFRELELELVDPLAAEGAGPPGEWPTLDTVGAALEDAGAIPGGTISKVSRALGPLATAPPDLPEPLEVTPGQPARLAVQSLLLRYTRALVVNDVGVRRDLEDSVHQMRVAARRLRSGLRVFEPLLDVAVTRPLREELAWLASVLGEVRDREVMVARLLRDLDRLGEDPHLHLDLGGARRVLRGSVGRGLTDAREQVLAALGSPRYLGLLDALVDAAAVPPTTEAAEQACATVLPPLVRRAWRRLARDVGRLDLEGPDQDWHETRIAAKRARYACEAVVPVFGKPARRLAERAELVTELLGEHQDAAVATETVQALAAARGVRARAAFALGMLCAQQRAAIVAAREELLAIWPAVAAKRWRRWLEPKAGR